jgi:excisionase family DNA binding protein
VTREHIDAAAAKLASLSKPDLMLIAESLGMVGTHLKSKTALQEAIRDRILARKGATQRAGLLDRDENKNKAKADPAVGELAENLRHTLDRGEGNVGLFSAADEATAVSKLREMRPDLKPVDLGAAMEASMREQADKLRVQWPVVEQAMAPDASESDRRNLRLLVNRALPKAIAAANDASGKSLIYGLGELARYGVDASEAVGLIHGGPLRDSRRQGASALVLVPDGADVSSGTSRQATALPVSMGGKPAEVTPAQQRSQQLLDEVAAQNLQASQAQLAQEEARRAEANRPEQEAAQQRAQQVAAERAADQAHNADVQARLGAAEAPATTTPTPTPADAAPTQPRKQIFTTGDVAKIMQVAPRTIGKWFDTGLLRGYRIPGSQDRRIPRDKLEAFLKEHMPPGQSLEEMEALAGFRKADKAAVAAADAAKQATPAKPAPSEPKPQKVQVPEHFADQGFTSDVAQHQGKSMAPGALIKQAQQSGRYSFVGLAQQTGWYTNGKIVFRLPPKEKEKFDSLPPAEGRLPDVASVIESTRKGADSAPATLAGARADPNNPKLTHYHLTSESGRQALVDGDQFETIKRRLPDATMHLGKTPDDPILFKQDGQAVGVLMPLHGIDRSGRVPYRDSVTKSYRRTGNPSIWRHRVRSRA